MYRLHRTYKLKQDKKPKSIKFFSFVRNACTFIVTFEGFLVKATLDAPSGGESPTLAYTVLKPIQDKSFYVFLFSSILLGIALITLYFLNRQSGWSLIKELLNGFANDIYKDRRDTDASYHRVTLFQFKKRRLYRLNFSKLIPKVRSGIMFQESKTFFRVGNHPDNCEGVAGKAWHEGVVQPISDLPDIVSQPTDENIIEYSQKTFTSETWISEHSVALFARSFYAIRVEANSDAWGVLVLDSKKNDAIPVPDLYRESHVFLRMLSKIIKDFKL